jgi:hypothetical protein
MATPIYFVLQMGQTTLGHVTIDNFTRTSDRVYAPRGAVGMGRVLPLLLGPHLVFSHPHTCLVYYGLDIDTCCPERVVTI